MLDEAFDIGVWHLSATVKAIISREPLSINPKNRALITKPISAPAIWGTNHPPTFKENTEAMVNRLLIVLLKRVFEKDNPVGVAAKARAVNPAWEPSDLILARERAGLLNWMLIGLQRVLERGNFINTGGGEAALDEMKLEANPVGGFIARLHRIRRQRDDVDSGLLCRLHRLARGNHGDEKANFSRAFVGKHLRALAHPRHRAGQARLQGGGRHALLRRHPPERARWRPLPDGADHAEPQAGSEVPGDIDDQRGHLPAYSTRLVRSPKGCKAKNYAVRRKTTTPQKAWCNELWHGVTT